MCSINGLDVLTERSDHERHTSRNQARNEMDIPAQTIEPGHDDRRTKHRGGVQCGRQLRSPVQRIGSLTRLDLNVAVAEVQALGGTKVLNGLALAFQSE